MDADIQKAQGVLETLRAEVVQLPEDPYIVLPENNGLSLGRAKEAPMN